MKTPILINADEMHRQHPDTFHRPSDQDLRAIDAGSLVKVCGNGERFWVEVTRRKGDVITALPADADHCVTFHAGTALDEGRLVDDVAQARGVA